MLKHAGFKRKFRGKKNYLDGALQRTFNKAASTYFELFTSVYIDRFSDIPKELNYTEKL